MLYSVELSEKEISDNHRLLEERSSYYRGRGLDFFKSREFILAKAGKLEGGILELGAGKGITALSMARHGYRFTTIDTDKDMLKLTAMNLAYEGYLAAAELQLMDACDMRFGDESFGNVITVDALHHIDEAEKMFFEAHRVLSPGGNMIISDFTEEGMRIIDNVHLEEGRRHESSGVTREKAHDWLERLGYRIDEYRDKCHWLLIGVKEN
jgi:ubiquinone/menaquinone biosynthesis C-methylase UbiE